MARTIRKQQASANDKRSSSIRDALQMLLKARVRSSEEKIALAKFLQLSKPAVESMLYYGKGGLDAWISALVFCYELDPKSVGNFLLQISANAPPSKNSAEPGDREWHELSLRLSADQKFYWSSLIRAAEEAEAQVSKSLKIN